jgi:hypothetical protein
MSDVVTKDELLENEVIALNWPLIVDFVDHWLRSVPDLEPWITLYLATMWREEMT